jgi:hypothetical protein
MPLHRYDEVRHDYAEPFARLLGDDVLDAGQAIQADREAGRSRWPTSSEGL